MAFPKVSDVLKCILLNTISPPGGSIRTRLILCITLISLSKQTLTNNDVAVQSRSFGQECPYLHDCMVICSQLLQDHIAGLGGLLLEKLN